MYDLPALQNKRTGNYVLVIRMDRRRWPRITCFSPFLNVLIYYLFPLAFFFFGKHILWTILFFVWFFSNIIIMRAEHIDKRTHIIFKADSQYYVQTTNIWVCIAPPFMVPS